MINPKFKKVKLSAKALNEQKSKISKFKFNKYHKVIRKKPNYMIQS